MSGEKGDAERGGRGERVKYALYLRVAVSPCHRVALFTRFPRLVLE
jgi:hypothetical protein